MSAVNAEEPDRVSQQPRALRAGPRAALGQGPGAQLDRHPADIFRPWPIESSFCRRRAARGSGRGWSSTRRRASTWRGASGVPRGRRSGTCSPSCPVSIFAENSPTRGGTRGRRKERRACSSSRRAPASWKRRTGHARHPERPRAPDRRRRAAPEAASTGAARSLFSPMQVALLGWTQRNTWTFEDLSADRPLSRRISWAAEMSRADCCWAAREGTSSSTAHPRPCAAPSPAGSPEPCRNAPQRPAITNPAKAPALPGRGTG